MDLSIKYSCLIDYLFVCLWLGVRVRVCAGACVCVCVCERVIVFACVRILLFMFLSACSRRHTCPDCRAPIAQDGSE